MIVRKIEKQGALHKVYYKEENTYDIHKGQRLVDLDNLTVSVKLGSSKKNHVFQVDEVSQNRLVIKGYFMLVNKIKSTKYKTIDNEIVNITHKDIANILEKASILQDTLWEV